MVMKLNIIEQVRKYIIKNKHDGLLFAISSHGDTGKAMIDSECNKFDLHCLFSVFSPEYHSILDSYKETELESKYLFHIPKIFFLDMCKGKSTV